MLGAFQHIKGHDTVCNAKVGKLRQKAQVGFTGSGRRSGEKCCTELVLFAAQGRALFGKKLWAGREVRRQWVSGCPAGWEVIGSKTIDQLSQGQNLTLEQRVGQFGGEEDAKVGRGTAQCFQCLLLILLCKYKGQLRVEPVERRLHFFVQDPGKQRVAAQVKMPAPSGVVGACMGKHLVFNAQDVAGVVDKDGPGAGRAQFVVLTGEQRHPYHGFHAAQMTGKSRLCQKIPLCRLGKALLLHDGDEIFHDLCVQIDILHRLQSRTHGSVSSAFVFCGGRWRADIVEQLSHKGIIRWLIAWVG